MIIEFELQGSLFTHKGLFDTTGFWAKFENQVDDVPSADDKGQKVYGFKIFSHFSFAFYHEEHKVAKLVWDGLTMALGGRDWAHPKIGFIREVC